MRIKSRYLINNTYFTILCYLQMSDKSWYPPVVAFEWHLWHPFSLLLLFFLPSVIEHYTTNGERYISAHGLLFRYMRKVPLNTFRENCTRHEFQKRWSPAPPARASWSTTELWKQSVLPAITASPCALQKAQKCKKQISQLTEGQFKWMHWHVQMDTFKPWLISPICLRALIGTALMHC